MDHFMRLLFCCVLVSGGAPQRDGEGRTTSVPLDSGGGVGTGLTFSQVAGSGTILVNLAGNTNTDTTSVSVPEKTTTTITTFMVSGTNVVGEWVISNSLFHLAPVTESQTEMELIVAAGETLDYAAGSTVTSTFTMTETGGSTGSIDMTLTLIDVNEAPVFSPAVYTVAVADGSGEGTVAVTVTATDPEGTSVMYVITAGNPAGDWTLDSSTGAISVANRKSIDTATTPLYALEIIAMDGGSPPLTSTVTVNINGVITFTQTDKAGTNDTQLRGNTAADVAALTLEEGTTATIATFTIGGATGTTTWTSSNGDLIVTPESADVGALSVAPSHTLDYEAGATVMSTLTMVDSASPPATGLISLTLTLTDVNDNAPTFASTSIDAYITDGSAGSAVTTVTAVDADGTAENRNVVYAIKCYGTDVETGNERHRTYTCSDLKFETDYDIDHSTGVITVANGHTVTSIDQYNLLITATDPGVKLNPLTASASVTINPVSSAHSVHVGVVLCLLLRGLVVIL